MTVENKSAPKLVWLLNTQKGYTVLKAVMKHNRSQLGLVVSYTDPHVSEDFYADMEMLCAQNDVPFISWQDFKNDSAGMILAHQAQGLVAIGWQYLLPESLWQNLAHRLIVFHDSLLPRYRGFAPVATGMIKGDTDFGVSVLYAGEGVDDGDILLQKQLTLGKNVYMAEAIERMSDLYGDAAIELCDRMCGGSLRPKPQEHELATYSIWRGLEDCRIEWTKTAEEIHDLIRAVSKPYPGAYSSLDGQCVKIWRAEIIKDDIRFEICDPGKIWSLEEGMPLVVCGQGLLKLTHVQTETGEDLLPVKKLRQRFV